MEVQKPFGFVTACYSGDKFMVGATLASMRHYCPDVPICLIADGDVEVSDLKQEYDLIVLRIDELPSREMSQRITGMITCANGKGMLNTIASPPKWQNMPHILASLTASISVSGDVCGAGCSACGGGGVWDSFCCGWSSLFGFGLSIFWSILLPPKS